MKRFFSVALILVAAVTVFQAGAQTKLTDGFFFAEEAKFQSSGWRYQVVLQVKGGKIVSAKWNGVNDKGLPDKVTEASEGRYGMKKISKLGKEWHEQAAVVEKYLVDTQDVSFSKYTNAAGNTDVISGASIHVKEFFDLAKAALAAGPVAKGIYAKDGWFYAKAPEFDKSGYAATALVTVVNGRIVSVTWNAVHKAGGDSKLVRAVKGSYKMGAKEGEWNVQAERAQAALLQVQDPAKIALKADGKADAISGVSIGVSEFVQIVTEALKAAK